MSSFSQIIGSSQPVLVDFFAEWCGPCKMQTPILKKLSSRINGKAKVLKVDVDKNQKVAAKYGIRSVPTLILFKNGQVKWKGSGVYQADHLEKIIQSHL